MWVNIMQVVHTWYIKVSASKWLVELISQIQDIRAINRMEFKISPTRND